MGFKSSSIQKICERAYQLFYVYFYLGSKTKGGVLDRFSNFSWSFMKETIDFRCLVTYNKLLRYVLYFILTYPNSISSFCFESWLDKKRSALQILQWFFECRTAPNKNSDREQSLKWKRRNVADDLTVDRTHLLECWDVTCFLFSN